MQFKTTLGKSSYWKRTKRRKKGIVKQRTGGGSLSMVLTSSMSIPESAYTWQQYGVRLRVQTRPIPLTAKKSEAKKKDSTLEGSTKVLIHTIELLIHKHVLTWRKNTYSTYKLEKEAKMAFLVQPEQIAKSSADNIETAPVPSFALLCGRSYPYLQWKKNENLQKMGQKRFRGRLRREGGKVECGEMWSRRSCGTALATGRVEFVTMQRKGWCFLFSFFWRFAVLGFFGSQQGPWLQFWLPLVVPKCGRFPLSLTPLNKTNWGAVKNKQGADWNINKLTEQWNKAIKTFRKKFITKIRRHWMRSRV